MLACRPMLCFATALMAGVIAARFQPGVGAALPWGWLLFLLLATWFVVTPAKDTPEPPTAIPDIYGEFILPRPGFLARRGLNRFMLIAGLGVFLLGAARQEGWRERLAENGLPARIWFDAELVALAPQREHAAAAGERWRIPALLIVADGVAVEATRVLLYGPGGDAFRRGDLLRARVRRENLRPRAFPGAFNQRLWLERDGLAASLAIVRSRRETSDRPYAVTPVASPPLYTAARRWIDAARSWATTQTLRRGAAAGGMLAAMLYGYRREVGSEIQDAFRRVGIGHVLAISGLHVGLIVGLLWWLSGLFGWPARWRALSCLLLALVYLGLTGGQVAASRATLMAVIHLAGIAWGRRGDMLNSLGAAAFVLTLVNPSSPLDISFQLSFIAVVFIYMALRRAPDRERPDARSVARRAPWRARLRREILSLSRLSVYTWFGLFPIIALVFNQVNLIGLPINIVVIPMMSLVLAGGLLLPWLGWIPGLAWLLCLPARALTWLALWADGLPYSSFPVHAPNLERVLLFYGFVFLLLLQGMIKSTTLRRHWLRVVPSGMLAAFGLMLGGMTPLPPPAGERIALLPGRGFGMIVAESAAGGVALIGNFARGGLNEAVWLHHLRRDGPLAVLAVGRTAREDLTALAFHYETAGFDNLPHTDRTQIADSFRWQRLAGAPGVEYAAGRDAGGKLIWLAVRCDGKSVCVAPRLTTRQLAWRLERKAPGFDAQVLALGLYDKEPPEPLATLPSGRVAVLGRFSGEPPGGWFLRREFGALLIDEEIMGYDGAEWVGVPAP